MADGEAAWPLDLLAPMPNQFVPLEQEVLNPRYVSFGSLTDREIKVLTLLADGSDTAEVGRRLFCSERTVKHIIHDLTRRLNVRNRTQAVAYALRHGLI
jgi:DNA-binding NarL/FixJ family response regulator